MSAAYKTAEQYERWHVRDCVRRGGRASKAPNWEGTVCRTCYAKALQPRGRCAGCRADRLLPGRRNDETPICRDCAGITRDQLALLLLGQLGLLAAQLALGTGYGRICSGLAGDQVPATRT